MKSKRVRTLDREQLLERILEEEIRIRRAKRLKQHNSRQRFYVILAIAAMAFFSFIAPIMN